MIPTLDRRLKSIIWEIPQIHLYCKFTPVSFGKAPSVLLFHLHYRQWWLWDSKEFRFPQRSNGFQRLPEENSSMSVFKSQHTKWDNRYPFLFFALKRVIGALLTQGPKRWTHPVKQSKVDSANKSTFSEKAHQDTATESGSPGKTHITVAGGFWYSDQQWND